MTMIRMFAALAWLVSAGPSLSQTLTDAQLTDNDVIILGELHDDPAHHRVQAETLERMAALGLAPSVVFEMIPTDLQQPLDTALTGESVKAADLAAVLRWTERGWGDFALYQPVFEAALANDLRIIAGDLPREVIRAIGTKGAAALPDWDRDALALDRPFDITHRARLETILVESHCGMLPADRLPAMVDVQRARDGSLAKAVAKAAQRGPVVLITGQGHARKDWAVPAILAGTAPHLRVLSIALSETGGSADGGFDAVVATGPAPKRDDPCAAFKAQPVPAAP